MELKITSVSLIKADRQLEFGSGPMSCTSELGHPASDRQHGETSHTHYGGQGPDHLATRPGGPCYTNSKMEIWRQVDAQGRKG